MARLSIRIRQGIALCILIASPALAAVKYVSIPTPLKAALKAKYPWNCVKFLRYDMGIKLPSDDLTYWSAKKKIINVTGDPKYGDVAVIKVSGKFAENGHVAMVQSVSKKSITILEAHYSGSTVTMREATGSSVSDAASQLKIVGYYRPK